MMPSLSADRTVTLMWLHCRPLDLRQRFLDLKMNKGGGSIRPGFMTNRASNKSEVRTKTTAGATPHIVSPDDRANAGKALRDEVAREHHGRWKPSKDRPNPIDILHKSDAGRVKELVPIRYGRMLQSPFAFSISVHSPEFISASPACTLTLRVDADLILAANGLSRQVLRERRAPGSNSYP
jgi:hypothetical protein